MGSVSVLKLSFIDFSEATEPGTAAWADARAKMRKALEEFGCFEARFDRVPLELRNKMLEKLKELFDLPLQTKLRNASKKQFHGYIGQLLTLPLYESMGFDDSDVLEEVDALARTLWPEGHPDFSKTLQSYSEKLSQLDKIVRRMILESLGVEKYLEEHLKSTNYLIRATKYKSPETTDKKVGLSAHTDKSIVTILCQNQVEGLEVRTKDGEWFSVKPLTQSFIVMIGDSFHAWTNGRLHSTYHRVMMTGNDERYSFGMFSTPKPGYMIKAPDELVDRGHPLLFKPFDYVKFTEFVSTKEGQKAAESQLKVYCGV